MNLQKVNVKLFTNAPERVNLDPFLGIFARWREERGHPAGWIDLADYAHLERGPGILLIGRQGNLGADLAEPGPGLLYANKQDLDGTFEERIRQVFERAIRLMGPLTGEPDYPADLEPRPGFWELALNDRLECPNTEATDRALRPGIEAVVEQLFGTGTTLIRGTDPARRYLFTLHSEAVTRLDQLTERVGPGVG